MADSRDCERPLCDHVILAKSDGQDITTQILEYSLKFVFRKLCHRSVENRSSDSSGYIRFKSFFSFIFFLFF